MKQWKRYWQKFWVKGEAWFTGICRFYRSVHSWDNNSWISPFLVLHLLKRSILSRLKIIHYGASYKTMLKTFTRSSRWIIKQWVLYWSYYTTYTVSLLSCINLIWSTNGTPCMCHQIKRKSVSSCEKESLQSWLSWGVFFSFPFFFHFIYISVSSSYKTVFKIPKVLNLLQRPAVYPTATF